MSDTFSTVPNPALQVDIANGGTGAIKFVEVHLLQRVILLGGTYSNKPSSKQVFIGVLNQVWLMT